MFKISIFPRTFNIIHLIMKISFSILFIFMACSLSAQSNPKPFVRESSTVIPEFLNVSASQLSNNLLNKVDPVLKAGVYGRAISLFADQWANYERRNLQSGEVISNWPELDAYLKTIVENVLPKEVIQSIQVNPVWTRRYYFNASMSPVGVMKVDLGVWANLDSEAALAALIAHEAAHFYMMHGLKKRLRQLEGHYDYGMVDLPERELADSRKMELEADSASHAWIMNSIYSIDGSIELYKILERESQQYLNVTRKVDKLEARSHPLSQERIDLLFEARKNGNLDGKMFIQDEDVFWKLKLEAIPEILESMMQGFNYERAKVLAFKYHLFYPDEEVYIYYLMESVRRQCYYNPEKKANYFITDEYYEKLSDKFDNKTKVKRSLFEKFDPQILSMSSAEYRRITARFYWEGDVKFNTNAEAYRFYSIVGESMDCTECKFSNSLNLFNNDSIRISKINDYINSESPYFDDIARLIKDKEEIYQRPKRKLTVLVDYSAFIIEGKETIPIQITENSGVQKFISVIDSAASSFDDRTFIALQDVKKTSIETFLTLTRLHKLVTDFDQATGYYNNVWK